MRVSYAIVFVSKMKRSVTFYRDLIGLPLKSQSSHWTEFATDGATLALHRAKSSSPSSASKAEQAGSCQPALCVQDLDSFHQRLLAAGVPCVQPPKSLSGTRFAQYSDPDGLTISISEERARQTKVRSRKQPSLRRHKEPSPAGLRGGG